MRRGWTPSLGEGAFGVWRLRWLIRFDRLGDCQSVLLGGMASDIEKLPSSPGIMCIYLLAMLYPILYNVYNQTSTTKTLCRFLVDSIYLCFDSESFGIPSTRPELELKLEQTLNAAAY